MRIRGQLTYCANAWIYCGAIFGSWLGGTRVVGGGQGPGRTLLVSARFARAWGGTGVVGGVRGGDNIHA